jgi:hypothetical protein
MNALDVFLRKCDTKEGRTLIVGSKIHEGTGKPDRRKLYKNVVGVDMEDGDGVDLVLNLEEETDLIYRHFGDRPFDHIECTSVLEHSRRPWLLCANLQSAMDDGATLLVMVPWVWRIHAYPSDYWRMTPAAIESLLPEITWERQSYIVENELVESVPKIVHEGTRYLARSELVMFGRKCSSTS